MTGRALLIRVAAVALAAATGLQVGDAIAATWVFVVGAKNKSIYHIDVDSIRVTGDRRVFWLKMNVAEDRIASTGFAYAVTQWVADCQQSTMGMRQQINYDDKDEVLESSRPIEPVMAGIVPDSVGEDIFAVACAYKKKP